MNKEDQINIEILSKIIIQLKTSHNELLKKFNDEIANIKNDNNLSIIELREKYDQEVKILKEENAELKQNTTIIEKKFSSEISDFKKKTEKNFIELREDMLKLLKKYEDKFQNQDEEILILKNKCEMENCKICNFESFKIHFITCEQCNDYICSKCLLNCTNCRGSMCLGCLTKCHKCSEYLCQICVKSCQSCSSPTCKDCFDKCATCNSFYCKTCLTNCRKCEDLICSGCSVNCEYCKVPVSCKTCFEKNIDKEKCSCGKLLCYDCEDSCTECSIPCLWTNDSRIFQGYHTRSKMFLPENCLIKIFVHNKGIDTTHLGLTIDKEFKFPDKATENFWSLCLNSGEKFSAVDYKKKGIPWMKYAVPVKSKDTIYLKYSKGEVTFSINKNEYPKAFQLDKDQKYFIYCLTHDDSTSIEIKSLKKV
jgi:hypothetical protein